jgi:hypothetical protein
VQLVRVVLIAQDLVYTLIHRFKCCFATLRSSESLLVVVGHIFVDMHLSLQCKMGILNSLLRALSIDRVRPDIIQVCRFALELETPSDQALEDSLGFEMQLLLTLNPLFSLAGE